MKLDDAAARLEALGNPTRLQISAPCAGGGRGNGGRPLARPTRLAASTLSHHLKSLVVVGLITQRREATTLICHANYDVMRGLIDFMAEECCAEGYARPPSVEAHRGRLNLFVLVFR